MPQLDTIYIFTVYLWTWFTLHLVVKKTKTLLITKTPKIRPHKKSPNPTLTLPWT